MRLALLGVGLIGGSFAAALRAAGAVQEVVGCDLDPGALAAALRRGILTQTAGDVADAVRGADLVVVATPVGATRAVFAAMAGSLSPEAIITDVGSTKSSVIEDARTALGPRFSHFVPAHPIAGSERTGVEHADASMFSGRLAVLTPTPGTDEQAVAAVESLWLAAGARTERLSAETHDRIFAAVSHLPHLLAFALVEMIAGAADAQLKLAHAGAGFRDFTRIAASNPQLWRDVCLANRAHLARELHSYRARLETLQRLLDAEDGVALEAVFARAAAMRRVSDEDASG
ncbi:MAG TPA: prephenate dehydrogenase/arogenate dehydrogenase family protein [Burkholderiaceae bacterium]|nr:prephenate dehydrogenase/arogenate dehydrogenase family protein [Burkholderiaceae bacterium]